MRICRCGSKKDEPRQLTLGDLNTGETFRFLENPNGYEEHTVRMVTANHFVPNDVTVAVVLLSEAKGPPAGWVVGHPKARPVVRVNTCLHLPDEVVL